MNELELRRRIERVISSINQIKINPKDELTVALNADEAEKIGQALIQMAAKVRPLVEKATKASEIYVMPHVRLALSRFLEEQGIEFTVTAIRDDGDLEDTEIVETAR